MRVAGVVLACAGMLALDQWMSATLTGGALRLWVWSFNGTVLVVFGAVVLRLYRDKQSAERGLMRFTREAVCLYGLTGRLKDANELHETLTGYPKPECIDVDHDSWYPEDAKRRAREAFALAADGLPQHFDTVCRRKDGTSVDVEVSYVPVLSGSRIVGVYGIVKDISEMKKNRELLHQSDKLAVVGELAAGIAHEIRNPLTSLRGFVQLSHENAPSLYTEIMLSEIDRIHAITSELLLLGKPKTLDFENKPIVPLLDAILTLVNTQAILHNVQMVMECRPEAEHAVILCEETKMKQVFLNVLKNAVEAMPNGGVVTIRLDLEEEWVRVRITDQGVGIPPEKLSKIGQAFFTTKESGTGLGLMISYSIIEQHRGRLSIESEPDVGTTVDIRLPVVL